ncbi:MAG: M1 family metallopeptidase [Caldilineales bacterium]|nr:M1 family metallopeptidase [Caldilineales bacterium]
MERYYPAFRAESLPPDFDFDATPRYDITMRVNPEERKVDGVARVHFKNLSGRPLNDLYFRLYPNLPQLSGGMRLTGVTKLPERYAAGFAFIIDNTAARVTLTEPLPPDESIDLELAYEVTAPQREGYVLFGESEGILSLPYSYPMLAAQTGDPTDPWRLDIPPVFGDIAITNPAFYAVTVTVPSAITLVGAGVEISRTESALGLTDHVFVTGPVREFGVTMSDAFESESLDVNGTQINSYYLPVDAASGRAALTDAAGALRAFELLFGPYPFTDLDIVESPTRYLGMEYPGLNYIGLDTYRGQRQTQELLVAHEVSHQWWYGLVGSDPFRYPWLDEGLAEHSSMLYFETVYGPRESDRMRELRWRIPTEWAQANNYDEAVGQEATGFQSENYEILVYAKSALFFDELYKQLGKEKYLSVLRAFIDRYRFKTPTPDDFLAIVQEVGGIDPQPLYEKWILSPPPND